VHPDRVAPGASGRAVRRDPASGPWIVSTPTVAGIIGPVEPSSAQNAPRGAPWRQPDLLAIGLVFVVQLMVFPHFPGMHSANEWSRLYLAQSLVDRHEVEITASIRAHGDVNDKSRVDDRLYSDKPPGTAFLAAPGLAVRRWLGGAPDMGRDLRLARILVGVLPTLFLLVLLRREMIAFGVSAPSRALVLATYGLGSPAFTYSLLLYGHQLTAVLLFATAFVLRSPRIGPRRAALAGFLGASCLVTEYQSAVYLVPLAIVALVRVRPRVASIAAAVAGTVLPLAALAAYHQAAFGSPFRTGYSFIANPFFASVHAQGFMGVSRPHLAPFVGSLFKPSKGMLFWSPFLALGFAGLVSFARRATRGDAVLRGVMVALPIAFVSSMVYWDGGWTVGQRHLTPLVPFLVTPAGLLLDRSRVARLVGPALAAISVMLTGLATVVYPHLPENLVNPFHDLTVPLAAGGCVARTGLGFTVPSWVFLGAAAAGFVLLAVYAIHAWPGSLRRQIATALLLALLPLAAFDASSRIGRLPPKRAAHERAYFENQRRLAGRWTAPSRLPPPFRLPRPRR